MLMKGVREDFEFVSKGRIGFKCRYLRGHYGTGKTLALRWILSEALEKGFVVSNVVLDDKVIRLDDSWSVYRGIMGNMQTKDDNRGPQAVAEILDTWNKKHFKDRWREFSSKKHELTPEAPYLMTALHAYFTRSELRSQVISWMMGDPNIPFSIKKQFDIRGDIGSESAMNYLSALSRLIHQGQYEGLVVLFDEVEAITRLVRIDSRLRGLENMRALDENAKYSFKHSYFVFAGTHDLFEGTNGVPSYPALETRLRSYQTPGGPKSFRDTVIELDSLPGPQRVQVLSNIKGLYESAYKTDTSKKVSKEILERIDQMAAKKGVDVREMIRRFIGLLDLNFAVV